MKANSVQEFELSGEDVRQAILQWVASRANCQLSRNGTLSGNITIGEPPTTPISGEASYDRRFKIDHITGVHIKVTEAIELKKLRDAS